MTAPDEPQASPPFSNVQQFLFPARIPQFPATLQGQMARLDKQEFLDRLHQRNFEELLEELSEKTAAKVVERLKGADVPVPPQPPTRRKGRPDNPLWWLYDGFRIDLCRLEQEARCPPDSGDGTEDVSKSFLAGVLGCDPVTITRAMKYHGLEPGRWPPSTWPLEAPPVPANGAPEIGHALAATLVFGFGALDYMVDGRMDGVVQMCRWLAYTLRL